MVDAGITTIRGAVVGDATRYDDQYVNPTWGTGVAFVDAGPIGGLVVNDGQTVGRSGRQTDPGEAAAREFARLLRERGVSVSDGWEAGAVEPGTPVLASIESAPLSSIVADMMTRSDNDTAEMLVKEIGARRSGRRYDAGRASGARHRGPVVGRSDGERGPRRWFRAQCEQSTDL